MIGSSTFDDLFCLLPNFTVYPSSALNLLSMYCGDTARPSGEPVISGNNAASLHANNAWIWPHSVGHSALTWSLASGRYSELAAISVYARLIKSSFLTDKIRDSGNAYGVGAICDWDTQTFSMYTFRDSSVAYSCDVFLKAAYHFISQSTNQSAFEQAKFETLSALCRPMSPSAQARVEFHNSLFDLPLDFEQFKVYEIQKINQDDVRLAVEKYLLGIRPNMSLIINEREVGALNGNWNVRDAMSFK